MGFFNDLKSKIKFGKAGRGQRLDSSSSNRPQQVPQRAAPPPKQPATSANAAGAQNAARQAAMQRQRSQQEAKAPKHTSSDVIRRRARAELEMEREAAEAEISTISLPNLTEQPRLMNSQLASTGVFFICPLTGTQLRRHEFDSHLKMLLDSFLEAQMGTGIAESEDREILQNLLFTLNECNNEAWTTCTSTLTTYMNNIIKNPAEEKFRKIRRGNAAFQKRVGSLVGMEKFLNVMGFTLAQLEHQGQPADFYIYTADSPNTILPPWIEQFSSTPQPIIFQLDRMERLFYASSKHSSHTSVELPVDFYDIGKTELRSIYDKYNENSEISKMLLTQELRDRLQSKGARRYKYCIIRIKFPDELILQGTFRPHERGRDLRNFVTKHLICDVPYELKGRGRPTPVKSDDTLEAYTPSSLLNFMIPSDVREDVQAQTRTPHLVNKEILSKLEMLE